MSNEIRPYGDNFIPVIESDMTHDALHPFCDDSTCPCREDEQAIAIVAQHVQNGLMTPEEATNFVNGKLLQGRSTT